MPARRPARRSAVRHRAARTLQPYRSRFFRPLVEMLEDRRLLAFSEFLDPHPAEGNEFGAAVVPLSTGNVVITAPFDDAGGTDAGAVYLFNGGTGELISTLTGSTEGDQIGINGVTALSNGNYVVSSLVWDNGAATDVGAVTWGNGITGVSGVVSAANSLVGSTSDDRLSDIDMVTPFAGIKVLSNGNYVVISPFWDNGAAEDAGAVTWGSGTSGVSGVVSAENSLVGSTSGDRVGRSNEFFSVPIRDVTALSDGNYVVSSPFWDNGEVTDAGAVTWGSGTSGVSGIVSAANSLVGSTVDDRVGYSVDLANGGITALSNGNYVVSSINWDNGAATDAGALTWGSGTSGVSGEVSVANSLVGSTADDRIGDRIVTALSSGNYVVRSPGWDNGAVENVGAVTWGNGTSGVSGVVSAANSLVGSTANDSVGAFFVTVLSNGNYVVSSPYWNNGAATNAGAVTWGSGTSGVSGVVSVGNSLVGSTFDDRVGNGFIFDGITALSNGNYVVSSPDWNNGAATGAGAVTWGNGATGTTGTVNAANSLVGSTSDDSVGDDVTALTNGNYVVSSPAWDNDAAENAGAVTWGSGITGLSGVVSVANSLVGSTAGDRLGSSDAFTHLDGGVTALSNGNYVVSSPLWDNGTATDAGAVTWGNGASGATGAVSAANSLVGSTSYDNVGGYNSRDSVCGYSFYNGVSVLSNGNYVISSPDWDNGAAINAGAVTWGSGMSGVSGVVSATNSLVGSTSYDNVGGYHFRDSVCGSFDVTVLSNGNYVISSPDWDNGQAKDAGSVTWGSGTSGVSGVVSAANSLVGTTVDDRVGNGGITILTNDNYVVSSPFWDNGAATEAGAVTWGGGTSGVSGEVSAANSLVGSTDLNDFSGVTALSNGNYLVSSPYWDAGAGAVTWGSGTNGVVGAVDVSNSLVGLRPSYLQAVAIDEVNDQFYGQFRYSDSGGRVSVGSLSNGVTPTDVSPTITSLDSASVPENTTAVMSVTATDPDIPQQTVTFAIVGGPDQSKLYITSDGVLYFYPTPDFENPTDADGDNVYEVIVRARDGHGGGTSQTINVTVTDVVGPTLDEFGVLTIDGSTNQDAIIAWLDADNAVRVVQWQGDGATTEHRFSLSENYVGRIDVQTGDGDDLVFIARNVPLPTFIEGGKGGDFLRGNNQSNLIVGGDGVDLIVGGDGRDVLIGGEQFDLVSGGGEDDVLIGGSTDNTRDELLGAFHFWAFVDDSFDVRADYVRQLVRPIGPAGFDLLFGGAGQNLTLTPPAPSNGSGAASEPSALAAGALGSDGSQGPWLAPTVHFELAGLLATIPALIASNPIDPADINADGKVTPLDALASINDINQHGTRSLYVFSDDPAAPGVCNLAKVVDRSAINPLDRGAIHDTPACNVRGRDNLFLDSSLDDLISPLDTLLVVNAINAAVEAGNGEGEAASRLFMPAADGVATLASSGTIAPLAASPAIATRIDRVGLVNVAAAASSERDHILGESTATSENASDWDGDLLDLLAHDFGRPL